MNRNEFEAQIVARAWKDEAFRQALKANPRKIMSEELAKIKAGAHIPEDVEIVVIEETPKKICLVIPPDPRSIVGAELSDEQLAVVAGGAASQPAAVVAVTVVEPGNNTIIDQGIAVTAPVAITNTFEVLVVC